VEVEIGVEIVVVEGVELWCPVAGDVVITEMLAEDGSILGLSQCIVVGVAWA